MKCTLQRNTSAATVSRMLIRRVAKSTRANRKEMILMKKMTSVTSEVHHDLGARSVIKWPALDVSRSVRRFRCVKYRKYFECVCTATNVYLFTTLFRIGLSMKIKATSRRHYTRCSKAVLKSSFRDLLSERKYSNQGKVMK